MRKATIFVVVAFLLLCAAPVYANDTPSLPHAFYGNVTINGSPASAGTEVEARGTGVTTGITGNPITTSAVGEYGGPGALDQKLIVQGDIEDEATITFYVNGESTGQTAEWHSGETTQLNLTVIMPSVRGAIPGAPTYIEAILFGVEMSFRIGADGKILETITATSEDGKLTITIKEGTIALEEDGKTPLSSLTMDVDPSPPDPPAGTSIIAAYDFSPDGATFDPGIEFKYTFDPEDIPEDVELVIAYYDEEAGAWEYVDCEVEDNTITASIEHFTCFAIIARAAAPPPPAPAPPPEVAPAPPAPPAPPVPPPPAPPALPPEVKPAINWPLIGGITAAVVIVVLLVYFLVIRRRAY